MSRINLKSLTCDEMLERKREQDRARQARYYEKNKGIILMKKKEATELIKQARIAEPQHTREPNHQLDFANESVPVQNQYIEPPREAIAEPKRVHIAKSKLRGKAYNSIVKDWKDDAKATRETNTTNLNHLYALLDTPKSQVLDLTHPEYVIARINNRTKPNGDLYATASNVKILQVLLKLVNPSNKTEPLIPIPQDAVLKYKKKHDALDGLTRGKTAHKTANEKIGNWDKLVSDVLDKEGPTCKRYVYLTLYAYLKCRDDLQLLIVPDKKTAEKNKEINYIIIPPNADNQGGTVILNRYKTDEGGTAQKVIPIPPAVVKIVQAYHNYKGYNSYLFGTSKNSTFVGSLLTKYGVKLKGGSIDLLRKMLRAKEMLSVKNIDDEAELAHRMGHSLRTAQAVYARPAPAPVITVPAPVITVPAPVITVPAPVAPKKQGIDIRSFITRVRKTRKAN